MRSPRPIEAHVELPDGIGYRLKRRLLGQPLHSDEAEHQRLGNPTALAVIASGNLRGVPRYFLTEPGMSYRFTPLTSEPASTPAAGSWGS